MLARVPFPSCPHPIPVPSPSHSQTPTRADPARVTGGGPRQTNRRRLPGM